MTDIHEKLRRVQIDLHAPKNQNNTFGNYRYRSAEDILEAVKPVLDVHGLTLVVGDEMVSVADRIYVKATAAVFAGDESVSASGFAREPADKKGMDSSQITGAASSYSRKYALNGLFAIDDSKDADTDEHARIVKSGSVASTAKPAASNAPSVAQTSLLDQIKSAMKLRNVSKADVDSFVAARHGFGSLSEALGNERVLSAVLGWVEEQ